MESLIVESAGGNIVGSAGGNIVGNAGGSIAGNADLWRAEDGRTCANGSTVYFDKFSERRRMHFIRLEKYFQYLQKSA